MDRKVSIQKESCQSASLRFETKWKVPSALTVGTMPRYLIFEVPLEIAQRLVGFKHDEAYEPVTKGGFMVLSKGGEAKGFLSRLLGK